MRNHHISDGWCLQYTPIYQCHPLSGPTTYRCRWNLRPVRIKLLAQVAGRRQLSSKCVCGMSTRSSWRSRIFFSASCSHEGFLPVLGCPCRLQPSFAFNTSIPICRALSVSKSFPPKARDLRVASGRAIPHVPHCTYHTARANGFPTTRAHRHRGQRLPLPRRRQLTFGIMEAPQEPSRCKRRHYRR